MAISKEDKEYIVNNVVRILKSPEKTSLIEQLREKAANPGQGESKKIDNENADEVILSVVQAIDELYS